jgi:ATP-binding cassette, subfamily B, multidrug efflux pump
MNKTASTPGRGVATDTVTDYSPMTAVRRLSGYMRPYAGTAVLAVLLSMASSGLMVLRPYLIKVTIDTYVAAHNLSGLGRFLLLFMALYVLRMLAGYALGYATGMFGQKVMHDLRMDIFRHILSMEQRFFDRNRVGRLMTRTTDDVGALNELYTTGGVQLLNNMMILAGIAAMMIYLDWRLAVVTFAILPLVYVAGRLFADRIRRVYRNIRRGTARLNALLQEYVQGMRIIQLMRRTRWSAERYRDASEGLMRDKVTNVVYYGWFFPLMEFIGAIGLVIVLADSGWRMEHGGIGIGVIVAFIRLVDMMLWPVRGLAENFNVMLSAFAASERIFTLLDTPPAIADPVRPGPVPSTTAIRFENVWFAYEGEDWVLRDVSFDVAPGDSVAFVGHSGAGKTSIINILMRFYDVTRGRVLIDGTDIRDIPLADLRNVVAYVGQEPFLFNRSVFDNISLGDPAVDRDRVHTVLERMCADGTFDSLEDGLDTVVRERGSRLSQGQRQLVSFARALAADRSLLVLDEATSSVDTFTERLIQRAVPVLMQDRTSLIIAHRLSTVRTVDRIHVIARGHIRESGSHDELMALDGIYANLIRMHLDE